MKTVRPAVVGGFVLGGLALAAAAIILFGGIRPFKQTTEAVIFFRGSVAGLDVGAPVTFRGVQVGSVQRVSIHLPSVGTARIPVYIEILPERITRDAEGDSEAADLQRLVDSGLRAQLQVQSLVTGLLRVDLDFRPGSEAETTAADTGGVIQIPALPSDFERLRGTLAEIPVQDLVRTTQHTLAAVENLAARLEAEIGPLLEGTRSSLDAAASALTTTEQAVKRLETSASHTLQELDGLAAAARQQLDQRGGELSQALNTFNQLGREADDLIDSLSGLTAPRSSFRSNLEASARDLAASSASLRSFARTIERDPSAVLRGNGAR